MHSVQKEKEILLKTHPHRYCSVKQELSVAARALLTPCSCILLSSPHIHFLWHGECKRAQGLA